MSGKKKRKRKNRPKKRKKPREIEKKGKKLQDAKGEQIIEEEDDQPHSTRSTRLQATPEENWSRQTQKSQDLSDFPKRMLPGNVDPLILETPAKIVEQRVIPLLRTETDSTIVELNEPEVISKQEKQTGNKKRKDTRTKNI